MKRTTKIVLGLTLVAAMVLGTAAVAFAAPALTLTPVRSVVTFPQPTWLTLVAADEGVSVATTVTIQYRPVGAVDWKKLRSISASRTAEGTVTVPVSSARLRVNTGFRAIAEGLESEVVTVSVKARLSRPVHRAVVKNGREVTIKGFIWPRHAKGSTPVTVTLWKSVGKDWVEQGTFTPPIYGHTDESSKWKFTKTFTADDKGVWRLQASHEDEKHAASTSRFSYLRVR